MILLIQLAKNSARIVNNYKYKLIIIVKDRKDTSRLGGILKGIFVYSKR